jgi:hypothetical protein
VVVVVVFLTQTGGNVVVERGVAGRKYVEGTRVAA